MDEISKLADRYQQGKREGLQEGKREGVIETARNMMREGMDIALIMRLTGLSKEMVEGLRKEV